MIYNAALIVLGTVIGLVGWVSLELLILALSLLIAGV